MFVFDKKLDPKQAINFKPSSKAPFGYMGSLTLATGVAPININATDPSLIVDSTSDTSSAAATACALLTKVHWDLGASDPIELEGLITVATRQILVNLLYVGLSDITVKFGARVFEYDPVVAIKKYYACFQTGAAGEALTGKLLKDGEKELAIELSDDEELSIQDNSFFPFTMKIVPAAPAQTITLASKAGAPITKPWGRTSLTTA